MKRFLKYGLLLLIFVGFLASSLELDAKECKQNYNTENHTFICSQSDTHQTSHADIATALPVYFHLFIIGEKFSGKAHTYPFGADPDPPQRLYLRYLVLLI
ncbi:MAG: hypothetical protein WKI04_17280 [Ferruginibacter sp.]